MTSGTNAFYVREASYAREALVALRDALPNERVTVTDALLLVASNRLGDLQEIDVRTV